jgi:tetratricopeptide (TPR) repeat protein
MNIKFYFLFILSFFLYNSSYSQLNWTLNNYKWEYNNLYDVKLILFFTVKNNNKYPVNFVGSNDIYLFDSNDYQYEPKDFSLNLWNTIYPDKKIDCWLCFVIPKSAEQLTLAFGYSSSKLIVSQGFNKEMENKIKEELEITQKIEQENAQYQIEQKNKEINDCNNLINKGNEYFYQNKYVEAIDSYESALGIDSIYTIDISYENLIKSYDYLGDIYFSKSLFNKAREYYEKEKRYYTNNYEINRKIQECFINEKKYFENKGDSLKNCKSYLKAISMFDSANVYNNKIDFDVNNIIEINGKISQCYEILGDSLLAQDEYNSALKKYYFALSYNNTNQLRKKIYNVKDDIYLSEQLGNRIELSIAFIGSFNVNTTINDFKQIFDSPFTGFNLSTDYRVNKYISLGFGLCNLYLKSHNNKLFLKDEGMDTTGIQYDPVGYLDGDRNIVEINIRLSLGYLVRQFNPYIIISYNYNFFNNNFAYYSLDSNFNIYNKYHLYHNSAKYNGFSLGFGLRFGPPIFKINASILYNKINGAGVLQGFNCLRFNIGLMGIIKI